MDEFVCRIEAGMQEDGIVKTDIIGSSADLVRCMGGLISAAAHFAEVPPKTLARDALDYAQAAELTENRSVRIESREDAERVWKERRNEGSV